MTGGAIIAQMRLILQKLLMKDSVEGLTEDPRTQCRASSGRLPPDAAKDIPSFSPQ